MANHRWYLVSGDKIYFEKDFQEFREDVIIRDGYKLTKKDEEHLSKLPTLDSYYGAKRYYGLYWKKDENQYLSDEAYNDAHKYDDLLNQYDQMATTDEHWEQFEKWIEERYGLKQGDIDEYFKNNKTLDIEDAILLEGPMMHPVLCYIPFKDRMHTLFFYKNLFPLNTPLGMKVFKARRFVYNCIDKITPDFLKKKQDNTWLED